MAAQLKGVGTDIEEVRRFEGVTPAFLQKVFTVAERAYCTSKADPHIHFAGTFCAKEAIVKACSGKISLLEIEILRLKRGEPVIYIRKKRRRDILVSISHTSTYAVAFAVRV